MAVRARLAAPREPQDRWPWHTVNSAALPASLLFSGQRRMEGESYLTNGYGIRIAIEAKAQGWKTFGDIATVSAPPRIKQIMVSPENGVPYLNTSQVFDPIPSPRKWLALEKTHAAEKRFVAEGTILVMASATVGRSIVATKQHENAIISHHFMRVSAKRPDLSGWIYGFLRSPQGQAMMSSSQYASIIRHIEPAHLNSLPIPEVSADTAKIFAERVRAIVDCRNRATELSRRAEDKYEAALGFDKIEGAETGFTIWTSEIDRFRRRFEAAYHAPDVRSLVASFRRWEPLGTLVKRVWWPNRFKRIFGEGGTPYMSADDVFTTNPYYLKTVLVEGKKDLEEFLVQKNWIIMARSGQIYGLNGSAKLVSDYHRSFFLSDDLIRIAPDPTKARAGYLITALTHPTLGRPLVIREAYGMSIPHLGSGPIKVLAETANG
ncbi:hypothetical protein [Mesorhizobium loti]|uniref:hypothetical protein n=1 Tax=Rhizobium loti TaxID=381 RepID=UPI00040AE7C4|nr:hypothetical protein [Mesorhizobium loti]